jgi:predicted KAP-like P-loop ATPase
MTKIHGGLAVPMWNAWLGYLNQPRAIKRFFAQVDALYPLVDGEVNFADFTLLTFLRTFEPNVYQLIIDHKQELTHMDSGDRFFVKKSPPRSS